MVKSVARRTVPSLVQAVNRLKRVEEKVDTLAAQLTEQQKLMQGHDFRIDQLKKLSKEVEPYQPTYGFTGVFENPARDSLDRARIIERHLGNPAGMRLLDIGSSIGYMCYYFADRGAHAEGWDFRPKNAEVSRLVGEINGINITVKTKQFDMETVKTIEPGSVDVVFILSVLHHILYYNDLEYTQKLMQELMSRVPILVVELARRGEDEQLFWNEAQPENELEIFDLIQDKITIEKIADIGNHLSKHTRPLYIVKAKQQVKVNNHTYNYDKKVNEAYDASPMVYSDLVRRYYFADKEIIKEYAFSEGMEDENRRQIIAEINNLLHLKDVHNLPKLIDFEVTDKQARIVLERIPGELLSTMLANGMNESKVGKIAHDVLQTLADLQTKGLQHNDIRSWNIILGSNKATVIDCGLIGVAKTDDDAVSLLWVIHAVLTGEPEGFGHFKDLPPEAVFKQHTQLHKLYSAVKKGERDYAALLKTLA